MKALEEMQALVKKFEESNRNNWIGGVPYLDEIIKIQASLIEELVRVSLKLEEEVASLRIRAERLENRNG